MRQNCRAFLITALVYNRRLRKLTTTECIVFERLKKNWTKQYHALWRKN